MALLNRSKIKGNDNTTTQIETQNIYYQSPVMNNEKYEPDEKAIKLLKETIEDEKNNNIIYVKTLSGRTIQCGNGKFTVNSEAVGEKEMAYWEDSFTNLLKYGFIEDKGTKGEVFKILKKGYQFYDKNIVKNNAKQEKILKLNDIHIMIFELLRENDYSLWERQLSNFFKADIDNEIAFNELIDNSYIINGMVATGSDGILYCLNPTKKREVLNILKERRKN